MTTVDTPSPEAFQRQMGRVYHQPIDVGSYTNKRVTVNYRAPLGDLDRLLPWCVDVDEIGDTGTGMISMCACDFWVTRFGPIPLPRIHTNEMLLRISAVVRKGGRPRRSYYTLRSDTSSRFLGLCGGTFSHFRKAVSDFSRRDDGEVYELQSRSPDDRCGGRLSVQLDGVDERPPASTVFEDVDGAADYVLELDGSCNYNYGKGKLSYQDIEYPDWDVRFCHDLSYDFPLLEYVFETYDVDAEFDCALYMEDVEQTWGRSWLYEPEVDRGGRVGQSSPVAGD